MDILLCNTLNDAIIAYVVKKWNEKSRIPLGRTLIQKICYFLKAQGVPINYDFDIYQYGPYSQELYFRLSDLIADGIIDDQSAESSHSEYVIGKTFDELVKKFSIDLKKYAPQIDELIDLFKEKGPSAMEILATIHYIKTALERYYHTAPEKEIVVNRVYAIKGNRFKKEDIAKGYDFLSRTRLFNQKTEQCTS